MHFHNMTNMTTPLHKNPCPGGDEIYNFGRPFLDRHYYIHSLPDLCLWIEKKIFKEMMHFHYMTYDQVLSHELLPRGLEIYNCGRPFLDHHYYTPGLSELCPKVEKIFFKKKYINSTLFTPKLPPL